MIDGTYVRGVRCDSRLPIPRKGSLTRNDAPRVHDSPAGLPGRDVIMNVPAGCDSPDGLPRYTGVNSRLRPNLPGPTPGGGFLKPNQNKTPHMKTYIRPLYRGAIFHPDMSGRYHRQTIEFTRPSKFAPIALMPLRLVVAAFMWLTEALKPDIDPDKFGYMFRSREARP